MRLERIPAADITWLISWEDNLWMQSFKRASEHSVEQKVEFETYCLNNVQYFKNWKFHGFKFFLEFIWSEIFLRVHIASISTEDFDECIISMRRLTPLFSMISTLFWSSTDSTFSNLTPVIKAFVSFLSLGRILRSFWVPPVDKMIPLVSIEWKERHWSESNKTEN